MKKVLKNSYVVALIALYVASYAGMGVHSCTYDGTVEFTLAANELSISEEPHSHHGHGHQGHEDHIHSVCHHCDEDCCSGAHLYQADCCSIAFYVLTDSQVFSGDDSKVLLDSAPLFLANEVSLNLSLSEAKADNSQYSYLDDFYISHQRLFSVWRL
ncbi:MAG: hypothetical protein IJS02_04735 [Bacteroidales bacterium]|nr:hypothetical protein [Bacteroidales bacterium]